MDLDSESDYDGDVHRSSYENEQSLPYFGRIGSAAFLPSYFMKIKISYVARRAILVVSVVLVCVLVSCLRLTGKGLLIVDDVTQRHSKSVLAPLLPFRNGNLSVTVTGSLDGDATLRIVSNHGRDIRTEIVTESTRGEIVREYEAWADDVVVTFEPGTAKNGHLEVLITCGK